MPPHPNEPSESSLRAAIERACQTTNGRYILEGRSRVAGMPREWVRANIERVGRAALDLADYWEYGRFLELLDSVGVDHVVRRLVQEGLQHPDADVRDMAELWSERGEPTAG